jgi:hypothetical protein
VRAEGGQVELLRRVVPAQPDGGPFEVHAGVGDAGLLQHGLQLQAVDEDLDAVGQLQRGAPLDVDDPEEPPAAAVQHGDEVRVVLRDGDRRRVDPLLRVELRGGAERGLVDVLAGPGGPQQRDRVVEPEPAAVQFAAAGGDVGSPREQTSHDLLLPAVAALQNGPHQGAAVEVVIGDALVRRPVPAGAVAEEPLAVVEEVAGDVGRGDSARPGGGHKLTRPSFLRMASGLDQPQLQGVHVRIPGRPVLASPSSRGRCEPPEAAQTAGDLSGP